MLESNSGNMLATMVGRKYLYDINVYTTNEKIISFCALSVESPMRDDRGQRLSRTTLAERSLSMSSLMCSPR